jgi:hypothetical protein
MSSRNNSGIVPRESHGTFWENREIVPNPTPIWDWDGTI